MAICQPVVKGHAWHQKTVSGVKPSGNNNPPVSTGNFFIYLEYKKGQNILPFRVWVNGKPYRVTNEIKNDNPVTREKDTLVAPTTHQVVQVYPEALINEILLKPLQGVQTAADKGKIVVEYYWRAKRYAYTFREIKMLEAARLL